jgi:hypothetical protein
VAGDQFLDLGDRRFQSRLERDLGCRRHGRESLSGRMTPTKSRLCCRSFSEPHSELVEESCRSLFQRTRCLDELGMTVIGVARDGCSKVAWQTYGRRDPRIEFSQDMDNPPLIGAGAPPIVI